jgi:hypothetical protein
MVALQVMMYCEHNTVLKAVFAMNSLVTVYSSSTMTTRLVRTLVRHCQSFECGARSGNLCSVAASRFCECKL